MIALCLLAYVIGVWLREAIRDVRVGNIAVSQLKDALLNKPSVDANAHLKWLHYSDRFILLKQKLHLSRKQVDAISRVPSVAFSGLILGNT